LEGEADDDTDENNEARCKDPATGKSCKVRRGKEKKSGFRIQESEVLKTESDGMNTENTESIRRFGAELCVLRDLRVKISESNPDWARGIRGTTRKGSGIRGLPRKTRRLSVLGT